MSKQTFFIIKPDAVAKSYSGSILARIEKENFEIQGLKRLILRKQQAEQFYAVHSERPFFRSLVEFMTSGPVIVGVLSAENAVLKWRELIGATDPKEAHPQSLRYIYGKDKERNAVHGSDSNENAQEEISFFFKADTSAENSASSASFI